MSQVVLSPWPGEHTVTRHLAALAAVTGVEVVSEFSMVPRGARVHLDLTDRVLGPDLASATAAAEHLLAAAAARGVELVVGLHDLPGEDAWSQRRGALYAQLAAAAQTVVVCSEVEAARVVGARDVRVVPLPVVARRRASRPAPAGCGGAAARPAGVLALGYVWPGRGHEELLAALPPGVSLVWVGSAAPGHDAEAARLAAHPDVTLTGWVGDDRREALLSAPAVPVAPNRVVSASASICSWWSVGRRPLVPDTPYTRELLVRDPGSVQLYDDLSAALVAALADLGSTYLPSGPLPGIDRAAAARLRFA